MTLQNKLNEMKEQFESGAPPEALSIMHKATDDLLNSGILDRSLKPGDTLPEFVLMDEKGHNVSSSELLKTGPLVTTFYRGVW